MRLRHFEGAECLLHGDLLVEGEADEQSHQIIEQHVGPRVTGVGELVGGVIVIATGYPDHRPGAITADALHW